MSSPSEEAVQSYPSRLAELAKQKPNAPAITCGADTLTWRELHLRTNQIAHSLATRGVRHGDLVTIALPNSIAFIEAAWALWKLGATPQPVSFRLPTSELNAIIELSKTPIVIASSDIVAPVEVVSVADLLHDDAASEADLQDCISACWKAPTSGGSTGRPKLILAGGGAVYSPAPCVFWRLAEDDVAVMPGPLYHNGPFSTACLALLAGAHLVVQGRFDAEAVLKAICEHKATWVYLVPTMMNRIWRLSDDVKAKYQVASLRTVWHLAAPCPAWLKEAWIDWVGPETVWELYAGTEAQALTVINGQEWLNHRGSVGRVFGGAQMKAFGADGNELPHGEIGEIFMKRPDGTPDTYKYIGAEAKRMGDWESLGDMGYFDDEGYLYLADRRTDMILVGGANIYPAEVEAALEAQSSILSCAVIGLPDDDLGNRIHAIVQVTPDFDEALVRTHLTDVLVPYKRPHTYEIVDAPLRDDAGKVRRGELRESRLKS